MTLIHTAHIGNNAELFPQILELYVPEGSVVADVTYGTGVFWRKIDTSKYKFLPSDLKNGIDFCKLPYENNSIDCLVLDPPYMPTEYTGRKKLNRFYAVDRKFEGKVGYHYVLQHYLDGIKEANRVLTNKGILIVKCQDMVWGSKQWMTHVDIINGCRDSFHCDDLFVLVQTNSRPHPRKVQKHARKNHSYFLIFKPKY